MNEQERVGNIQLEEELFRIPPSTYYRGTNRLLGNEVIVRRLPMSGPEGADRRETFFRAQRHAARLTHPSILRPIDIQETEGTLWGIYEYHRYLPSRQIVERGGPAPLADTARVAAQVADAIAFMHRQGFVHGRIAPREVGVTPDGHGFLLSVSKSADLEAGIWPLRPDVLGLSPFSAPEEFGADARPDATADLHGLAATIYWWLTAQNPRGGRDEAEALERARAGAPAPDVRQARPEVPAPLAEALTAALAADPDARRGSAAALTSLLDELHRHLVAEVPSGFETGCHLRLVGSDQTVQILGRHGGGAFGIVFRAREADTRTTLAVKALKPQHRDDSEARQRFVREAEAIRNIHHANVVGIRGVGEHGDTPFVAMDFIPGQTLATVLLREGSLPPSRAARLAAGISRGLAAIHEQGVVHRDLKPHNIIVRPDGRPVITDFGVARDRGQPRLTLTGQLVGTPAYMAPEQLSGEQPVPAADLYALGAILYEMLTGETPFPGRDTLSTIRAIRESPPPGLPADVPGALSGVVLRLLAKKPAERYADATATADALEEIVSALGDSDEGDSRPSDLSLDPD